MHIPVTYVLMERLRVEGRGPSCSFFNIYPLSAIHVLKVMDILPLLVLWGMAMASFTV